MQKDNAYLEDVLEAAKAVQRFTAGISLEDFKSNEEKYEAVNRKFEIIGEAARRLSPGARNIFPKIPWKLMTAMRNLSFTITMMLIWMSFGIRCCETFHR